MNLVNFINTKSNYIIPVVLFLGSFFIYSYDLEGQPWHGDEINYLGWAGNYIELIKKGDFSNSCLISIDDCNLLYHIPAHGLTYSPLRMLVIGLPMEVRNIGGDFYNWSCYYFLCYNPHKAPAIEQMTAGRLLSPLFGALTISISFMIGKILFNRHVGIIFSILFLFYDLWLWYSRTIMTEVHYIFFAMLSFLLLLYAFNTVNLKIRYFVISAITFGLALASKILAVELSVLFIGVILFGWLFKKPSGTSVSKRHIHKIVFSIFSFFTIAVFSFFLTQPGFYENPLNQILLTKKDMDNYNRDAWFIGYPTIHGIQIDRMLTVFHYTIFPSFLEHKIPGAYPNSTMILDWYNPPTYSSIALTLFFFIGFVYLIQKIRGSKNFTPEVVVLIWFISTFIFALLIARDFSLERYLLPFLISIIFIASYGFWNVMRGIANNKTRIGFVAYFIFAHSMTALLYWRKIYFSPHELWNNPLHYGTLQESLDNTFTLVVNVVFMGFFLYVLIIRFRKSLTLSHNA